MDDAAAQKSLDSDAGSMIVHLGKQLKVGPVANCPSPPGAFLLSFDTLMFNLLVLMPLLGSVVYRLVQRPKLEMFFSGPARPARLASNMGTDGVFSGQNITRVSLGWI